MKKRIFTLLLALCLVVGLVPAVSATEIVAEGACGENLTWVLDDEGTLTISGKGTLERYDNKIPWSEYEKQITTVVMNEGITSLSDDLFHYNWCPNLKRIYIPKSLTHITPGAFLNAGLIDIIIADGNTSYRFQDGCLFTADMTVLHTYLDSNTRTYYEVPHTVTEICGEAFMYSRSPLATLVLPQNLEIIGTGAFMGSSLSIFYFLGSAPQFGNKYHPNALSNVFAELSPTVYYPGDDETWTEEVLGYFSVDWNSYTPVFFEDVMDSTFYAESVRWAMIKSITTGATDTTFNPNGTCLRAHVVTFLWRAAGCPEPKTTVNPFTDVTESDFYYKAVLWAVEEGITNGTTATTFSPFAECNRAAVVTFLYRAMGEPAVSVTSSPFSDVDAAAFYGPAVVWAVENGVTNGMGDGTFGINTACNRAQVVTFLYRTYN